MLEKDNVYLPRDAPIFTRFHLVANGRRRTFCQNYAGKDNVEKLRRMLLAFIAWSRQNQKNKLTVRHFLEVGTKMAAEEGPEVEFPLPNFEDDWPKHPIEPITRQVTANVNQAWLARESRTGSRPRPKLPGRYVFAEPASVGKLYFDAVNRVDFETNPSNSASEQGRR
jgi:hypothetical protein